MNQATARDTISTRKKQDNSFFEDIPLPTDEKIAHLASLLQDQMQKQKKENQYASVKHVLTILGAGAVISAGFLAPPILLAVKPFLDAKREYEFESWKQFNQSYLKRTIRRLQREKFVEIHDKGNEQIVTLTKNGKRRILKYSIEELTLSKPNSWDGQWRLIMYDVAHNRKKLRDLFRGTLKNLGFFQLQESVWIYPYPCEKTISFLREYYGVGNEVIYVVATRLEDDSPYRTYFHV